MNRYDYNLAEFSLDRAEIRYSADTAIKNCAIITGAKKLRISSIWGHDKIADLPNANCRSAFTDSKGNTHFICGNSIYTSSSDDKDFQNIHYRGDIGTEQGYISWAESQSQNTVNVYLYFTDGVSLWRINTIVQSDKVQNIDSHLPIVNGSANEVGIPSYISFYQHRLLMTCQNSNQWYYSELDPDSQEKIFNDLNFYSAETKADRLLRILATDIVYLFGERTVEVWQPTGDNQHPFRSNTSTNFGIGTTYPQSVIDYQNSVYFVATDNHIYHLSGGQMRKISGGDLSYFFKSTITASFPLQTNRGRYIAFKRGSDDAILFNPMNNTFTLAPSLNGIKASFWLDGEFNGIADLSVISRQAETALSYSGEALVREIKTPIVFPDSRILCRTFEFNFVISPLASQNEDDNQIFVSMSPDGGMTWRETRKIMLTSNQGICRLHGFGWAHNAQFKIVCSNKQMLDIHRITLFYDITAR